MIETLFDLKKEDELIRGLSKEASFCLKGKRRALFLAHFLLDEGGKIAHLDQAVALLEKEGYILGENTYNDGTIIRHFLKVLKALQKDRSLVFQIQKFSTPILVPELVAFQLEIEKEKITDREVRWAILSALLTPLRQSIGSCFATAPAILIHEEQHAQFLRDMEELLYKGTLKRVKGGVEAVVPISPSPGVGELKKDYRPGHPGFLKALATLNLVPPHKPPHQTFLEILEQLCLEKFSLKKQDLSHSHHKDFPKLHQIEEMQKAMKRAKWTMVAFSDHLLLKVWEFTIASFVDVKTEFSNWNLFSSLGLHAEEKEGIGEIVYHHLQTRLDEANEKLAHFQQEYEIAFDQVRATERLMKGISSESEGRRLKGEHQARLYHMQMCLEMRDTFHDKAKNLSQFFTFFLEKIIGKFQVYFQEVYDAEMQEVKGSIYDDSPAGFRLLYKHGRSTVSSWTFIYTRDQYIQALKEFFTSIEYSLIEECTWDGGREEIPQLITAIVHYIRSEGFIVSAFRRMAKAHRVPLKKISSTDLDQLEKKPWAYTSGGNLPLLLKAYFRREGSFAEEGRWVCSVEELAIFLLETMKLVPPRITDLFVKNPERRLLANAPTHTFSLLPGQKIFREGWEDSGFTYTWLRDEIINPRRTFYKEIRLSGEEQSYLLEKLVERLPLLEGYQAQRGFQFSEKPVGVGELRKKLPPDPSVDAFFFEMLPLISKEKGREVAKGWGLPAPSKILGRRELHDYLLSSFPRCNREDPHLAIATFMEKNRLAPPSPFLFADTNWAKVYFSFLINPSTLTLELWRTDQLGLTGAPMYEWDLYLNGGIKEPWTIFVKPVEYS